MPPDRSTKPIGNGSAPAGQDGHADPAGPAVLRILRGNPSAPEIAAIVVAVAAAARQAQADRARVQRPARSEWTSRARRLRQPLAHSPGGWRASSLPR